jgi:hypothetical protein
MMKGVFEITKPPEPTILIGDSDWPQIDYTQGAPHSP